MKIIDKKGNVINSTPKAYEVVYSSLGFKPYIEIKEVEETKTPPKKKK